MMEWFNILRARLRALFRRESVLQDIEEELRVHVEMETETNIKRGMPPDEARAAALKSFGNLGRNTELGYDIRGGGWLEALGQDLRYGARMLLKNPGFTLIAVITLALGIGANTAIFTLFYSMAWRPLPVKDPAGIVSIYQTFRGDESYGRKVSGNFTQLSYPEYLYYRDQAHSFAGFVAYTEETFTLSGGEAERVNGQMVTDNYFSVLGGEAVLGRTFVPNECQTPGACPQVVLSYDFWQRRFGSDPGLIGKTLTLNRQPFTVVGVAARSWVGTEMIVPDVWVPLTMSAVKRSGRGQSETNVDFLSLRDFSWLSVIGRLKTGVSLKQAQTDLDLVASQSDQNDEITSNYERKTSVTIMPGTLLNFPEARDFIIRCGMALLTALGLVLVVVCANVSNLLLARAISRRKEISVRLALGASRGRLIRQLMTESLLLALLGGTAGFILASWLPRILLSAVPIEGLHFEATPNRTVIIYCLLASLLTAILFGLAPAFQATKLNLASMIKAEGTILSQRLSGSRLRHLLVIIQVAVSFVILVCAGLLARGLQHAKSADLGFEPDNVFVLSLDLASAGYDASRAATFYQQLIERMTALPGVESVSLSGSIPFSSRNETPITLEGSQTRRRLEAQYNVVSQRYFQTLRIPIIQGRHFDEQDIQAKRPNVVVSQTMAERFWPGQNPIGKRFNSLYEVIGVAKDISATHFGRSDGPLFYVPAFIDKQLGLNCLLRTRSNQQGVVGATRDVVRSLDSNVVVSIKGLEEYLARKLQPARFGALFSSMLSLLALALVVVGMYGVMAFFVNQRMHEIGIRKALGAQTSDIFQLVFRQGIALVIIGLVIGLAVATVLTRFIVSQLYGVSPTDPATFAAIALLLTIMALLACWIPAWRATKMDPMIALRAE
jgi:macrolide transport system ATP-binding/permease protein